MMPDPSPLAPVERDSHRSTLNRQSDVAAWEALQAGEIVCGEAEAALRAVDVEDDPLGYAFAVAALAGARAATAQGWVAYAALTGAQDDAPPARVHPTATARRCVVCDQPDTGAAA